MKTKREGKGGRDNHEEGVATRFVRRGGSRGRGGSLRCYGLSGINRWPWRVAKREFDDERRAHQIEAALSVELSPGILGNIFDEIQVSSA